jgi:hypothetical protein
METDELLVTLTVRYFAFCLSNISVCVSGFYLWRQINRLSLCQIFCILFVEYFFNNRVVCFRCLLYGDEESAFLGDRL